MLRVYLRQDRDSCGLLADALSLNGISSLPPISRTEHGKPFFPDLPCLHFNLSHTEGWSLCALSDRAVGVDIERVRPRREGLFRYCLTEEEYARFSGTWPEFFCLWTQKEAWCKYTGQPARHPRRWPTPPPLPYLTRLTDDFAATVCAAEAPLEHWVLL